MEIGDNKKSFEGVAFICMIEFGIQLPLSSHRKDFNPQLAKMAREFVRRNIDNMPITIHPNTAYGHTYLVTEDPASYLSEADVNSKP